MAKATTKRANKAAAPKEPTEPTKVNGAADAPTPEVNQESPKAAKIEVMLTKIRATKSLNELKALEPEVGVLFGELIPDEIQAAAGEKYQELIDSAAPEASGAKAPVSEGWIPMTADEAKEYEKKKLLVGWSKKKQMGLLKKDNQ